MGPENNERFKVCQSLTEPDADNWYHECADRRIPLIFVLTGRGQLATVDWDCITAIDGIPHDCRAEQKLFGKVLEIFSEYGLRRSAVEGGLLVGRVIKIRREHAPKAAGRLAELFKRALADYTDSGTCTVDQAE